jgi:hypothetical protein
MKSNDADIDTGLKTLDEVEALNLSILKYFEGKSESPPLKKDESLILSSLNIYFGGERVKR